MSKLMPWDQPISDGTAQIVLSASNMDLSDPNVPNMRIFDFGCGNGRYMEVFARYVNKQNVYGSEIDPERVSEVRKKGFRCDQLTFDCTKLPYEDNFFDIVFSSNVIEHIPRKQYLDYLYEIYRVLRPKGRFLVGTPNYPIKRLYDIRKAFTTNFAKYYLLDDPTHCNKLSIRQLEKDLSKFFVDIHLDPSYILFEEKFLFLKRAEIRKKLRVFGDKVFGYCVKPEGSL